MKAQTILAPLSLAMFLPGTIVGQATFQLQNLNPSYGIDAPVFDAEGLPLAGTEYRAELWGAATPDALVPAVNLRLNETRLTVPFLKACLKNPTKRRVGARGLQEMAENLGFCRPSPLTGRISKHALSDGYFFSTESFLAVPSTATGGGGYAWLQVRAWDARIGSTYEEVAALGIGGYGESPLFYAPGGDPFVIPATPPGPLIGLQSFSLRPVPEPSTWALLALGGLVLGWTVRQQRRLGGGSAKHR